MAVVTGGSGFIGARLVEQLVASGWSVRSVDAAAPLAVPPGVELVEVDLTAAMAEATLRTAFAGADVVVHSAAVVADDAPEALVWRVNVDGTARVLAAAEQAGVGRVVHVSSIVVHGPDFPAHVPLPETARVRMSGSPYTDTKVASEHLAMQAGLRWAHRGGPEVVVARPGDVFGPGSVWARRPVELLRRRLAAVPSGNPVLAPVWVDDLVDGLVRCATVPEAAGGTYTFTAGEPVATREVFAPFAEALGVPLPTLPAAVMRGLGTVAAGAARIARRKPLLVPTSIEYVNHPGGYANDRAVDELGWHPTVSATEAVARTVAWCREAGPLAI